MEPMSREVMVIPRNALFPDAVFQGFVSAEAGGIDYERRILNNYRYLAREEAEQDPAYKQPIGYALLVNPSQGLVFAYRRASRDRDYPEKRLQGKWSWGLGGHIERADTGGRNPLRESMLREISEEVGVEPGGSTSILGYLNDDSDPVGKVHFGILYVVETEDTTSSRLSAELAEGAFYTREELAQLCSAPGVTVEKWSRIALEPLCRYLDGAAR